MVNALIAAALVLSAFIISTAVLAHVRARLASMSRVMAWLTLGAATTLPLLVLVTYLALFAWVTLSIGLEDLVALFAAAVVAAIARVMSEATRVADENAKFD